MTNYIIFSTCRFYKVVITDKIGWCLWHIHSMLHNDINCTVCLENHYMLLSIKHTDNFTGIKGV